MGFFGSQSEHHRDPSFSCQTPPSNYKSIHNALITNGLAHRARVGGAGAEYKIAIDTRAAHAMPSYYTIADSTALKRGPRLYQNNNSEQFVDSTAG